MVVVSVLWNASAGDVWKTDAGYFFIKVAAVLLALVFSHASGRPSLDVFPQQFSPKVTSLTMGEAPMTICMVIEFSNLYQQVYSEPWYQTLVAANSFIQTLKPDDYIAIVAYDLRAEEIDALGGRLSETARTVTRELGGVVPGTQSPDQSPNSPDPKTEEAA